MASWWLGLTAVTVCGALLASTTARAFATNVAVSVGVGAWYCYRLAVRPRRLLVAAARDDRQATAARLLADLGAANARMSSAVIAGGLAYVERGWIGDTDAMTTACDTDSNRSVASDLSGR